jgi:hypothetical protein
MVMLVMVVMIMLVVTMMVMIMLMAIMMVEIIGAIIMLVATGMVDDNVYCLVIMMVMMVGNGCHSNVGVE